jgi:hypothetical protein
LREPQLQFLIDPVRRRAVARSGHADGVSGRQRFAGIGLPDSVEPEPYCLKALNGHGEFAAQEDEFYAS